ncbi:MAG: hypothetical protein ACAH81_02265 [Actinomycetota bacterium]
MPTRTQRQLDLLGRMAALDPPLHIIGGYAEDALIGAGVSREHEDVDWLVPRSELSRRLNHARELGFDDFETYGESAPGQPFYLTAQQGELSIDIGVSDEVDGGHAIGIHRLLFEIEGKEPPAGFRVHLPPDTFTHDPVEFEGVRVWPASPLCLYQMRIGIASRGAFGELNEKQRRSLGRLKDAFFADRSDDELMPRITPLPPV